GDVARSEVLTAGPPVSAGVATVPDDDALDAAVRVLDADDRVGPFGHWRAGHDADGIAGADRSGRNLPGGNGLQDSKEDRTLRGRRRHVGRAHGVAVHGRVIP